MNRESRQAVIMFADLVGSTQAGHIFTVGQYADLVADFHAMCDTLLYKRFPKTGSKGEVECAISGDQLFLLLQRYVRSDLQEVLDFILELKWKWLFSSKINFDRLTSGQSPLDIGIGVHVGTVTKSNEFRGSWLYLPYEHELSRRKKAKKSLPRIPLKRYSSQGFSINVAKRVEGFSRQAKHTRMVLSYPAGVQNEQYELPPVILSKLIFPDPKPGEERMGVSEILAFSLVPSRLHSLVQGDLGTIKSNGELQVYEENLKYIIDLLYAQPWNTFLATILLLFVNCNKLTHYQYINQFICNSWGMDKDLTELVTKFNWIFKGGFL